MMAARSDVADYLYDELLNTARLLREANKNEQNVDALRVDDLHKLTEAFSFIAPHFHHKKDKQ